MQTLDGPGDLTSRTGPEFPLLKNHLGWSFRLLLAVRYKNQESPRHGSTFKGVTFIRLLEKARVCPGKPDFLAIVVAFNFEECFATTVEPSKTSQEL